MFKKGSDSKAQFLESNPKTGVSCCKLNLVGGWAYPSEKYDLVSWDNDYSQYMERHSKFHGSSHHQPGTCSIF